MYYLWNAYQEVNIDNDVIEKRIIAANNRMLPKQGIISKQNVYSHTQSIGRKARTQSPYSNVHLLSNVPSITGDQLSLMETYFSQPKARGRGGKRTKRRRKTRRKQRTRNRRKKY